MKLFAIAILLALFVYIYFNPSRRLNKVKESLTEVALIEFLEKADDAYIRSFQRKNVDFMDRYATDEVIMDMINQISYGEEVLYGTSKYRKRDWEILERGEYNFTIKKSIRHEHIRVNRAFNISIGEDVTELWHVRKAQGGFKVTKIVEWSAFT